MSHNAGNEVGQTTGIITYPTKPAFLGYVSSTISNVTGNNTLYTVIFDSEKFDYGADFNTTTGIFTAPVAGAYHFSWAIWLSQASAASTFNTRLVTTDDTIYGCQVDATAIDISGAVQLSGSCTIDMGASATAVIKVLCNGVGADTVDIAGSTDLISYFSGYLVG